MPANFNYGHEHKLYLNETLLTGKTTGTGGADGVNAITWGTEFLDVRDLSNAGSPQEIDVGTRESPEARAIVLTTNQLTFQVRYRPQRPDFSPAKSPLFDMLIKASENNTELAFFETDGSDPASPTAGDTGFSGNASVGVSGTKPLAGLVVFDMTLSVSDYWHWVRYKDVTDKFVPVDDWT